MTKQNAIENGDLYIYIVDLPIENADFPYSYVSFNHPNNNNHGLIPRLPRLLSHAGQARRRHAPPDGLSFREVATSQSGTHGTDVEELIT